MKEAAEVKWMKSGPGLAAMLALGVASAAGAIAWARNAKGEEARDRRRLVAAAAGGAIVSEAFVLVAKRRGWVSGGLMDVPTALRLAIDIPYSTGVYTAWLMGYRALAKGSRHPLMIGAVMGAGLSSLVMAIEPWEIRRGYFQLGSGWHVANNAAITPLLGMAPVAAYEGLKRVAPRSPSPFLAWYGGQGVGLGV